MNPLQQFFNRVLDLLQRLLAVTGASGFFSLTGNSQTISGNGNNFTGSNTFSGALYSTAAFSTALNTTTKTTAYTLAATDGLIEIDTTGGTFAITLNKIGTNGQHYIFKDVSGNCGTASLTFTAGSGVTIKGTATISTNYGVTRLMYDATNFWYLVI